METPDMVEKFKARLGAVGEVVDSALAWMERNTAETADSDVPILSKYAHFSNPALVGVRAANARWFSGGGKYFKPEPRDERYFSKEALKAIAKSLPYARNGGGRTEASRFGKGTGVTMGGALEASQTVGGYSIKDGKLTDKFDINSHYDMVPDVLSAVAGFVLGKDSDPDAGKIHTEIPLSVLDQYRQAAKGGAASGRPDNLPATPDGVRVDLAAEGRGPRIVINPTTFKNSKDALCVAFNEAFRILMETNGFEPQAEPTEKQRKFFSDTAYADDEVMMRRTILARICTFDTSVSDPTDEQLQEALEFLNTVLEIGAPQNQWEQWAVRRIVAMLQKVVGLEAEEPAEPQNTPANADAGGGVSAEDEELKRLQEGASGVSVQDDTSTVEEREQYLAERGMDTSLAETGSMQQLQQMHEEQMGGGAEAPKDEPTAAQPAEQGGQPAEQPVNQGGQPPQPPVQGQASTTTTESPKEETTAGQRNGAHSGIWTGGEPGKGRELTAREAEWMQQRIESGARVSDQQLSMMGYKRDENGAAVPSAPSAAQGNIDLEVKKATRRRRA